MQTNKFVNGTERQLEWNAINWRNAFKIVRNLRQRIFRASQQGDHKKVRSLQKLMLKSYSNTLVSVRKITQVNQGKKTAGVDQLLVKTPVQRRELVATITTLQVWKTKPTKRIYIPKKNGKLRPLSIPTIIDRCIQAKVKNALEPYWENHFERTSYGFRPGRGCHDAIAAIYAICRSGTKKPWVVDADIKGAFDNIDHNFLLETLKGFPAIGLIKEWLKAGYVDKNVFYETETGTPQGGPISPLLANIALHGMEEAIGVIRKKVPKQNREFVSGNRTIVKYADDWAAFCESKEDAEEVSKILSEWLSKRGLTVSPEKTRIVHLSEGFNFLGFNIRQYPTKKNKYGCKLLIKPSKESVKKLRSNLLQEWRKLKGCNSDKVISTLNPIIRGWANYFRIGVSYKTFSQLDHWMWNRQYYYARHMHPRKSYSWLRKKYWGCLNEDRPFDKWVFGNTETGQHLLKFKWFKIERHIIVKGTASLDDPSLYEYWKKRLARKAKEFTPSKERLAKKQNHICPVCKQSLYNSELLHKHHIKPKAEGGGNKIDNLILVHLYCHQQIHSRKFNNAILNLKDHSRCK